MTKRSHLKVDAYRRDRPAPYRAAPAERHNDDVNAEGRPFLDAETARPDPDPDRHAARRGRALVAVGGPGSGRRAFRALAGLLAVIALLFVAGWVYDSMAYVNKIHPGVKIAGVDVGGLTRPQATRKLGIRLAPRYQVPIVVAFKGTSWKIPPSAIGAELDVGDSIDKAMAYGRSEDFWNDSAWRMRSYLTPVEVTPTSTVDRNALNAQLTMLAKATRMSTMDPVVVVKGTDVTVQPPRPGRELDRRAAAAGMIAALPRAKGRTVKLNVPPHRSGITEASAEAAAKQARTLLSSSGTVRFGDRHWTVRPDDIARSLGFVVMPKGLQNDALALVPTGTLDPPRASAGATGPVELGARIDPDKLGRVLGERVGGLGRQPVDARFVVEGTAVRVAPSITGQGPDMRSLARELTKSLRSTEATDRVAALRLIKREPRLTTAEAQGYGIKQRISTFGTRFGSDNKTRVNNIRLLAKAIDGSLVPPGETWSLNGHVGERTAEKGYMEANAIIDGKLVPQLGGGICQVASTVFNAIFFSGEPVEERSNHSFYISHYPTGRDATVSWDGPDLKFRNDTGNWILIKTATTDTSVDVSLYGTDPGYKVAFTTSPLTKTTNFGTEVTRDPTLPVGTRLVKDAGIPGYDVTVVRTVTRNGKTVRTDTFKSKYKPKVEIVVEGTKK